MLKYLLALCAEILLMWRNTTTGVNKYINPKIHSEGSFHVLYDKLDKLVRQCQAVQSHLQICESCTIDFYTGTNQVLMSDNPESQRSPEIFHGLLKKRNSSITYIFTSPSVQWTTLAGTLLFQSSPKVILFHCAIVPWNVMEVSEVQSQKAAYPILVTLLGIVIEVNEEH